MTTPLADGTADAPVSPQVAMGWLPADLVLLGHCGVTIAWQIRQHGVRAALFAHSKQVDVLGAAWGLGRKRQALLLGERVDAG